MSDVVGSRNKLKNKLKLLVGREKAAKDGAKSVNIRKQEFRGNGKEKSSRYKTDNTDSSRGPYKRENSRKRNSSLGVKQSASYQEGFRREVDGNNHLENRKRSSGHRDFEGRKSNNDHFIEEKSRKRAYGRVNVVHDRKYQDVERPGRKSSSLKGRKSQHDDFIIGSERDFEGRKSNNDHFIEEKSRKRASRRANEVHDSKSRDVERPSRKFSSLKGRKSRHDDFIIGSERVLRTSRVYNGGNDNLGDNEHHRKFKDRNKSAGVSDDKVRSKSKATATVEKHTVGGEDGLLKKWTKSKLNPKRHADLRHNTHQLGYLDNSSKKKASHRKGSDDDSVVTDDLPRRRKRLIRIDPHDISNKRIDDGISTNEKAVEKNVEKSIEVSQNAQFRAIQPSPAILSFVEDNLLGRRRLIDRRRSGYSIKLSAPLDNIPFSTSPEREKVEENVFRNKLTFFAAAKVSSSFPPPELPEIAFAGRSNVGKSSLLNALTRQWGVVRTSDKPGLTQTINFFKLASKLCLVDLPGYGFAYAKDEVKDAWEELVKEYVSTRVGLKRVCLLIDTKWGMKPRDHELIDLMERSQTKYQIVLTKTDMIFPINVARRAMQIQESLKTNKSAVNPVMMVSSKSGAGIRSLRSVLARVARLAK